MAIRTVLLSESTKSSQLVNQVLADSDYQLVFEESRLSALMSAQIEDVELIILCINIPDDQLLEQLKLVNQQYPLPIVIFTEQDGSDAIEHAIAAGVSAYVVDGLSEQRLLPIIRTALARFQQNQQIKQELDQLRTSLADRKVIDRAKGIIMAQRQCSEDEAYTLMRNNAMTQNLRMAVLAKHIIDTANLLTPS